MGGSGSKPDSPEEEAFMNDVRGRYREVKPEDEKPIKIEKLWIFPIRGLMGIEMSEIQVSKLGVKYDREWALYETGKLGVVTQKDDVILTQLRQNIEKDPASKEEHLVITIIESHRDKAPAGLSHELRIPIRHVEGEVIDTGKVKGVHQGKEYDEWFSKFIGKDVTLLRAAPGFKKVIPLDILRWGVQED